MITMMMIVIIMMVTMTVRADAAFDSYQGKYRRLNTWNIYLFTCKNLLDSMAKYKAWHSKYGLGAVNVATEASPDSNRIERNVHSGKIFRPHR